MQKLPESELDVMLALWETDNLVPRSYFDERLKHKNWNVNTINTYLTRLQERGYVVCEKKGRINYYKSLIGKNEYLQHESKSVLQKLYGNSLKNFIVALNGFSSIDAAAINELQAYLDALKEGE